MKQLKNFLIYLSIFCIVTVSIFSISSKTVYAEVPDSMKAIPHNSSWGSYDFSYTFHKKYWTIQDPTGIPTSLVSSPNYFYKDSSNDTFIVINGADLIQLVLTRGLSIVLNPEIAPAVIQAFFNAIGPPKTDITYGLFVQGGVYDGQNNFLGYALNDISNCYYEGAQLPADTLLRIPSQTTNNVKNFYDYYNKTNYPDYINVIPPSKEFINNNIIFNDFNPNGNTRSNIVKYFKENIDRLLSDNTYCFIFNSNMNTIQFNKIPDNSYFIQKTTGSNWDNLCNYFELTDANTELLFTEMYLRPQLPNYCYVAYEVYNNDSKITEFNSINLSYDNPNVTETNGTRTINTFNLGHSNIIPASTGGQSWGSYVNSICIGDNYTIYKDLATYNSINVTKDYKPDVLTGSNYYNYNVNEDNSINTTIGQIDNSENNNTTIYNEGDDIIINNTTDGTVNPGQVIIDIDITIDNTYPDYVVNPDNPSNPENPSDPEDPDTILDAILDALKKFFGIIGKLLGTVLAGILEVIDALLESIAGIMDNLTGVTDFIGALFSWLPTPVPQILGVGISICILAAIIKFIRG